MIDLEEIKKRCEAATPGPWEFTQGGFITEIDTESGERICSDVYDFDSQFIVHARDDIPALIAEIERLRHVINNLFCDCAPGMSVNNVKEHLPGCPCYGLELHA